MIGYKKTRLAVRFNASARIDPSRTGGIVSRFQKEINKRWRELKKDIAISIVDRDAFGIQKDMVRVFQALPTKVYEFKRTEEKVQLFMKWLEEQESLGILQMIERPGVWAGTGPRPWANVFIDNAYAQGIRRARDELRKAGYKVASFDAVPGGVGALFSQPVHAERLAVLYSRAFEDLKSVTQFTNAQVRRAISEGLTTGLTRGIALGKSPRTIARDLMKDVANKVDKIGVVRARMIARTEVVRAHHVAQMEEYKQAQAEGVEVEAEWITAADPCEECEELQDGGPYSIEEAEALIPAHPNCRCSAKPVVRLPSQR
jgi:SPP1 gp7 family putative phage head morphogenesis protein